jgi:methyl-accepting chemotaxis protein
MKIGRSLTVKFIATLLIILFIGQGLGLVLFILSIRDNLVDSLNEKMSSMGSLLSGITAEPISQNNGMLLNRYLTVSFKDEDFISIAVLDKNNKLLEEKRRFGQKSSEINPFYVESSFENQTPVLLGHEKIGSIVIKSSSKRINDEILKRMIFAVIYQGILLVVVAVLVTNFFNRNIRKPMSDFSVAVNKVGTGDLTVIMQSADEYELSILAKGLNSLIARLRNTVQKLHSTTNDVTMAIKQINLIIGKVNEGTYKQLGATEEVITALENVDHSQKKILESTHNLSGFSEENLSSLFEIKSTAEEIADSSEQLFQASSDAYSTIAEMSAAAKAIAKSTEDLSTSTEETSASVEQIGANLKEVENTTKESARLAAEVREVASDKGMMSMSDAMDGMEKIEEAVDKSLELVRNLGVKSKDIEKILSVITDVTKQTNLLSVNAAVLAAQAGEYGKGFSVVADEIKILADRTSSSAKGITNIIKSIQMVIAETAHVTENSKHIVSRGKELVIKIGGAFGSVLEGAQKSSEMTKTIQRATEEQVRGILQIKEAMQMIVMVVEQVSNAAHEQESGSEHLLGVAEKVKEISDIIKRGMQEQNTGIRMISKNLELANDRIKHIDEATSEQGKTNENILSAAERIRSICNNTLLIAQDMSASFSSLYQEADNLKRDMERFKLE